MEMIKVVSSAVDEIGFDDERCVMRVQFNGGGTYDYYGIPEWMHYGLLKAPSKGTWIRENLKDVAEIPYIRVS